MTSFGEGRERVSRVIKYSLIFLLMISSGWFMSDVWKKFQSEDTTFHMYRENHLKLPTTVLCFKPIAKKSVLKENNMTMYDYVNLENLETIPINWVEFQDKVHMKLEI